jgi:hypothetical protein
MKAIHWYFILLFTVILATPSCDVDDDGPFWDCTDGEGPRIEKTLDMPEFTGIKLEVEAKVFITQGDTFEVLAKGEENVIDELELDVQNDTWNIEFDDCTRDYDLEIFITMPQIEYLAVSGSGEIRGENFFDTQDIVLRISGSGNICLGLNSEEVDGVISGSGDLELEGDAENLKFKVSGSGDLSAFDLITQNANIEITGSGSASVHVLEVLDVRITGSGDVFYKGHPTLNVDITGSGDVIDAN